MSYRQGDVVLVPFPFSNLTTTKKRPSLVVSADWYNSTSGDCVLAAITSSIRGERDEIHLKGQELQYAGLPREGVVRAGKLFTIDQTLIEKSLGHLPCGCMKKVVACIKDVLEG